MMAKPTKERCPHCAKKMENIGTSEKPQWICRNHEYPIYVPPLANADNEEGESNDADS